MEYKKFTLEDLPQVTQALVAEVQALRTLVESSIIPSQSSSDCEEGVVGIDEACRILRLKKPTVYHKVQRKEIKSYRPNGCKKLLFKRSELVQWVLENSDEDNCEEILAEFQKGIHHKPASLIGRR